LSIFTPIKRIIIRKPQGLMEKKIKKSAFIVTLTGVNSQTAQFKVNNNNDLLQLVGYLLEKNKDTISGIDIKKHTK
jgi:hypothetical protein